MTQWADISGRGTCFRRGDPDAVGGHVALAYWDAIEKQWAWSIDRINATGRTVKKYGTAWDAEQAKQRADRALSTLNSTAQGNLF